MTKIEETSPVFTPHLEEMGVTQPAGQQASAQLATNKEGGFTSGCVPRLRGK